MSLCNDALAPGRAFVRRVLGAVKMPWMYYFCLYYFMQEPMDLVLANVLCNEVCKSLRDARGHLHAACNKICGHLSA